MKKKFFLMTILLFVFTLLVACSSETSPKSENQPDKPEEEKEVVEVKEFSTEETTVKVATPWGEEYFMERIGEYVQENYPHLMLEHIDWNGTVESLEELYAAGTVPDVFLAYTGQQPLEQLDSVFPLDEMVEMYGIDLEMIQPTILAEIRSRDTERKLVGIPQEIGLIGLYYNKEIFDLLGVEYPSSTESMNWDKAMDLAKEMTVERNGVNYCGLAMGGQEQVPLWELSTNMTDPETGEVLFTSEPKFSKYMELMDQFYSIPNILAEDCSFESGTAAMSVNWHGFMANNWMGGETPEESIDLMKNMDIAPVPTWADAPDVGPSPLGVHPWVINNHSENKEAALQFILAGITEDYQLTLAKAGTPSVLNAIITSEQYGEDNVYFEGKNTAAFFATTPATPPEIKSVWDQFSGDLDLKEFAGSNMDIQAFLRVSAEKATISIEEAKSAQ